MPYAPLAIEAFRYLAGGEGPRPDVLASLFAYHQLKPAEFLPLLSLTEPVAHRRILGVAALSGNPARMPLLVDLAVHSKNADTRRGALYALAGADLEGFSSRLHRAAGDADRRIRFHTAVALVPSGEPWAVRLLVAEMDEERSEETQAARRSLGRLPSSEARRLLEEMVWDGTANLFAVEVLIDLTAASGGIFDDMIRRRIWELISNHLDSRPVARRIASRLDWAEAARDVCSRLP
ncbi:MAG: HEAT repeat domain-containing protein [bacterium]|nr:HEAT repeat domain-containing protein [bacterium]